MNFDEFTDNVYIPLTDIIDDLNTIRYLGREGLLKFKDIEDILYNAKFNLNQVYKNIKENL